jgi:plasmid stability protein
MPHVKVTNVEDWVLEAYRVRAARHGHSLAAELRDALAREANRPKQELAQRLRQLRDAIHQESGELSDSTPGIRADRDARG